MKKPLYKKSQYWKKGFIVFCIYDEVNKKIVYDHPFESERDKKLEELLGYEKPKVELGPDWKLSIKNPWKSTQTKKREAHQKKWAALAKKLGA